MTTNNRRSGCEACGALAVRIPERGGDTAMVTCGGCGKPLGTIGFLRERLIAAIEDEDDAAPRSVED